MTTWKTDKTFFGKWSLGKPTGHFSESGHLENRQDIFRKVATRKTDKKMQHQDGPKGFKELS